MLWVIIAGLASIVLLIGIIIVLTRPTPPEELAQTEDFWQEITVHIGIINTMAKARGVTFQTDLPASHIAYLAGWRRTFYDRDIDDIDEEHWALMDNRRDEIRSETLKDLVFELRKTDLISVTLDCTWPIHSSSLPQCGWTSSA